MIRDEFQYKFHQLERGLSAEYSPQNVANLMTPLLLAEISSNMARIADALEVIGMKQSLKEMVDGITQFNDE